MDRQIRGMQEAMHGDEPQGGPRRGGTSGDGLTDVTDAPAACDRAISAPPGVPGSRRRRPHLVWELVGCALRGHQLLGTEVAHVRAEDAVVIREGDGLRWHRCLRCDSWLPLPPPAAPSRETLPPREQIAVPLRGRPLRDRFVLRLIAVDRFVHFLVIGALAVGIFLFAHDEVRLRADWARILNRLQGGVGGPIVDTSNGWLQDVDRLFAVPADTLLVYGAAVAGYAVINLLEGVGLWIGRRWAEYLALVEVLVFVPIEVHELVLRVSPLKIVALVINLAIAAYLLFAHRLFGVRGGDRAYRAERQRDTGWQSLERTVPVARAAPAGTGEAPPGADRAAGHPAKGSVR